LWDPVGSYSSQIDTTSQELAIAEGQLRDHEARLGRTFTHNDYQEELAGLRDLLKAGLSQATPAPGSEAVPVASLAERIKALKAAHTIDAAPTRTATRRINAEMPVTARIRRRIEPAQAIEPEDGKTPPSPAEPIIPKPSDEPPPPAEIHPLAEAVAAAPARPQADYRRQVAHGRRKDAKQLSLF